MPSSSTTLRIKQYLAKESNYTIVFLTLFCYAFGILSLFVGLEELYKMKTLVIGQCQVRSIDLKTEKYNDYPHWFITVLHDNQKSEDIIVRSTGYLLRRDAWHAAHDYRINETHPCYRWKSLISTSTLSWQWNKPPESNIEAYLFIGITLIFIVIAIPILRQRYQAEFGLNHQQQIEISLRDQQGPPPTYDKATQFPTLTTTQTRT